jgi:ankyrin repeat protein
MVVLLVLFQCRPSAGAVDILEAARAGDAATVRAILQTNAAAASLTNSLGETALQYAILYRWIDRGLTRTGITNLQELFESAWKSIADPEIRTVAGRGSPVDAAALRSLLASGKADPAQTREELKVVELLLAAGADPNAPDLIGMTPFHCAAFRPQPEFLEALLEKGGNVLAQTSTGETPLHWAAVLGIPTTVKLLLDKGAKVGKANRFGNTPIFFAVASGKPEIARLLLIRGAFADDINNDFGTPLNTAVRLQDREMVTLLLDQGHAAVNGCAGKLSETALHAAASQGDAAMVRLLLEHKADIHATDKEGYTPLLNAAEHGYMGIIEILVRAGADLAARTQNDSCAFGLAAGSPNHALVQWLAEKLPTITTKDKASALLGASMHGRLANVRWLLAQGVSASLTNAAGTPLLLAAGGPGMMARLRQSTDTPLKSLGYEAAPEADYAQIVSLLITNGGHVNSVGPEGRTPLQDAIASGAVLITEMLLRHKADIQARTSSGRTPLHQAASVGDARLVELLLTNGAVLEARDNKKFTPLHYAAAAGNATTIKVLLARGAVVSVRDQYDATPLHWAAMTTNVATVALLLDAGAAVNALDVGRQTPLHQAAVTGRDAVVKLLVERKADTTARAANGDTPTDLARKQGFSRIVTILSSQSTPPLNPRRE